MNNVRTWMIVEDEESLRQMLSAMLLFWDITPLVFPDGHQAMAWIESLDLQQDANSLPELALLDIRLPGPHGHEIAERLRTTSVTSEMTIVMMTAYRIGSSEKEQIESMAKPNLLVKKPLPLPDQLKAMIDRVHHRPSSA